VESGWTGVNAAAVSPELAVNGSIVFVGDENVGSRDRLTFMPRVRLSTRLQRKGACRCAR